MTQVFLDRVKNGIPERLEPYTYGCGNFMRANSTNSKAPLTPEASLTSLSQWIVDRKNQSLAGGVRMRSCATPKGGLFTIKKIEVV